MRPVPEQQERPVRAGVSVQPERVPESAPVRERLPLGRVPVQGSVRVRVRERPVPPRGSRCR